MNNIILIATSTGILGILGMLGLYYVNKETPEQTQIREQSQIRKQIGNNPNTNDIDYNIKYVNNPMEKVQIFGGTNNNRTKTTIRKNRTKSNKTKKHTR